MTREELRRDLYEQTGEWFNDDQLDDYLGYSIPEEIEYRDHCRNNARRSMKINYDSDNLDDSLLGDDLIAEVSDIVGTVLQKAKKSWEAASEKIDFKQHLSEIAYFAEIFACKSILYIILQKGNEKGYKWRDL